MFSFLSLPAQVIGLLESNVSPREMAAGVCLGMFLGFIPLNGPMAALLLLLFLILKINRVSTLLTLPLFKAAYMLGLWKTLEGFGAWLLIDAQAFTSFWRFVTGLPVIAYLDINNTLVAGGITASAILSIPLYFIAKPVAAALKITYAEKVKKSKAAAAVSGIKMAMRFDKFLNTDSGVSLNLKGIRQVIFGSIKARIFGRRGPAAGWRKRVSVGRLAAVIAVLLAIQFGVGLMISPAAGGFIIDTINRASGARISAERVNVWPLTLSFSMRDLKVFNPKKPDERIARAEAASFRLSPVALLSKRVVFSSINLSGAELDLEGRPDGSFNIKDLARPAGPAAARPDVMGLWKTFTEEKDAFSRVFSFIRNKYSKAGQEKLKKERRAAKSAREVAELPRGRLVRFKAGRGAYLFEIRKLSLDRGYIKIRPSGGDAVEIGDAHAALGRIVFDPDNGAGVGLFSVKGDVKRGETPAGRVNALFSQSDTGADLQLDLKDVDLEAVRFAYKDSLPVNVVKGNVTLSSRNHIRAGAIDSRTSFSLTNHRLEPKDGGKLAFGIVPMGVLVEALNGIDPVRLKFSISGTVEKPSFGGFQESLMALVKPYISNIQDRVVKQGTEALKDFISKKFLKQAEEMAPAQQ